MCYDTRDAAKNIASIVTPAFTPSDSLDLSSALSQAAASLAAHADVGSIAYLRVIVTAAVQ